MQHLTVSDMVVMFTVIGGLISFVTTVVILALKLQRFISDEFSKHRKIMYGMFSQRDRAIRRLEFWAVKQGDGFQPGVDPFEINETNGNGGLGK